ncbi:MAG TPA: fasciclin domain-containing protein [Dermatophilaceae bacterium]|nr:fasciclin domain-containing protein [Dermatophilaceae bacterium]
MRRITTAALIAPLGLALVAPAAIASPAAAPTAQAAVSAAPAVAAHQGTRSLATVLAADGIRFDHNQWDYDILDAAVTAVLTAKPNSKVALLADGKVALTAFLPNDLAFKRLYTSLIGRWPRSESQTFSGLAGKLGVKNIEKVLLYHVVPGATIDAATALKADGVRLKTALGKTVTVDVVRGRHIRLIDKDPSAVNASVIVPNINKGNRQIAHGISRVLRPVDL